MTPTQAKLYRETMQRGRKVLEALTDDVLEAAAEAEVDGLTTGKKVANGKAGAGKPAAAAGKKEKEKGKPAVAMSSGSNILMDLRKAASHPLLFRRKYTDAKVRKIAKECLNTPKWCESNLDYVIEDLEVSPASRERLD